MTADPYALPGDELTTLWTSKTPVSIALAVVVSLLVVPFRRRWPERWDRLRGGFSKLAERRSLCLLVVAIAPVLVRLALLSWSPPFDPSAHDDFGHLLVADTLLHGRLANPPHPLRRHFETIYVLQEPAYASKYPLGQGLVLALGRLLFDHPWAGVLIAVALMGGALTWALYAVLPPPWAVLGGLLAAFHLGLKNSWINSYMGGALAAFAGALLFGALLRFNVRPGVKLAFSAGFGWSLAWLIRPYESTLLFALLWAVLSWKAISQPAKRRCQARYIIAAGIPTAAVFCLTLLHNYRVTGSAFVLPYQHAQHRYGVPQSFVFQAPIPMPPSLTARQREMYDWQRHNHDRARSFPTKHIVGVVKNTLEFYSSIFLFTAAIGIPFVVRNPVFLVATALAFGAVSLSSLYVFAYPQYLAPYAGLFLFILISGLKALADHASSRRILASTLTTTAILGGLVDPVVQILPVRGFTEGVQYGATLRGAAERAIQSQGSRHVIVIKYTPRHELQDEWVYNRAEIDAAQIVWARYIDEEALGELTDYYRGRCFWLAEVGSRRVRLRRLPLLEEWMPRVSCPPGAFEELQLDLETVRRRR